MPHTEPTADKTAAAGTPSAETAAAETAALGANAFRAAEIVDAAAVDRVVRRYYEVCGALSATREDLEPLLHEELVVVEHPNRLSPEGARTDKPGLLEGFDAGRRLLAEQAFEVHEVVVDPLSGRAAVRATWSGTVGVDAGPFTAGQRLRAAVASFLRVEDEQIREHETFDCYDAF